MKFFQFLSVIFFVGLSSQVIGSSLQCLDMHNEPIDWYIIYKLPKVSHSPISTIRNGVGFYYMDSSSQSWTLSDNGIDDTMNALSYTYESLNDLAESENVVYVSYNDEDPDGHTSYDHGHTKGLVGFVQNTTGFWLIHSLPRWPKSLTNEYSYPSSGMVFGQTFLCISLPYASLDVIGTQMLYTRPWIQDFHLPSAFLHENPNLSKVISGEYVKSAPWNRSQTFATLHGVQMLHFAKTSDWHDDLYFGWLAPYYEAALSTETWQDGRDPLESICNDGFIVENIKDISFNDDQHVEFSSSRDHSKWAVSNVSRSSADDTVNSATKVTCIGDINRMKGQERRGGGTMCMEDLNVWKSFSSLVVSIESCNST